MNDNKIFSSEQVQVDQLQKALMYWNGVREYCNVYFCLNAATGTPTRHQSTATALPSTRWKTLAKMISFLGWLRSLAGTTVRGFTILPSSTGTNYRHFG